MKAIFIFLILTIFTVATALADEAGSRNEAAEKLIEVMNVREEMARGFEAAAAPMLSPMIQQLGLEEEQAEELRAIFTAWWQNDIDQNSIVEKFRNLYAETFTVTEMEELVLFYQTPLGQKVLQLMPEITARGMEIGMQEAQGKQALLTARVEKFMAKLQQSDEESPAEDNTEPAD